MKMMVYGKKCGRFPDKETGEIIDYKKIFVVKSADYVEQRTEVGVNMNVGGECLGISCIQKAFDKLPNETEFYTDGLLCDVEFDDRKHIVDITVL